MSAILQRRLMGDGEGANRILWRTGDVDQVVRHLGLDINIASIPAIEREAPLAPRGGTSEAPTREGAARYTFTISTGTIDRMNDSINVAGWRLDRFKQNPVVLWGHQQAMLPIGRAIATWRDGPRLRSTVELTSTHPNARNVRALLEDGVLRATSVGFIPLRMSFTDKPERRYGIDFHEQELIEWSIVSVPANPDALLEGRGTAADITRIADVERDRAKRLRDIDLMRLRAG